MTKKQFIQHAMRLRPTEKAWREYVEHAIRSGCIDYKSAVNFREVYPLAAAIGQIYMDGWLNGSLDKGTRRYTRREMRNILHFI